MTHVSVLKQPTCFYNVYMFHFAGRGGYNSREAIVQERRLLAPANSTTFSLSLKVLSATRKSL